MNSIKQCIGIFAEIMNENLDMCNVTAECFRLSKFNKREVDEQMFVLLFNVICICDKLKLDIVHKCDKRIYVFNVLQKNGFLLKSFQSREYLLALGWVISKYDFMSILVDRTIVDKFDIVGEKRELPSKDIVTCNDAKGIQQLCTKINISLRAEVVLKLQLLKRKYKISKLTSNIKENGLTINDLYVLRNPELMNEYIGVLKKEGKRVEKIFNWNDSSSNIFWQWMETVMDEAAVSDHEMKPNAFGVINEYDKLQKNIGSYESQFINLERLLCDKNENISKSELKSYDNEYNHMICNSENKLPTEYPDYEFIFTNDVSKTKDLKFAIINMQNKVDSLNSEIMKARNFYKQLLKNKIENLIVMDPL